MLDKPTSSSTGYNQEDDYFKKQEMELLAKRRAAMDEARKAQTAAAAAGPHWMKCPKCGGQMQEIRLDNVMVDKCSACEGVYFDRGELELLTQHQKSGGLLKRLFR
jgi:uncharacterized protein